MLPKKKKLIFIQYIYIYIYQSFSFVSVITFSIFFWYLEVGTNVLRIGKSCRPFLLPTPSIFVLLKLHHCLLPTYMKY
jgi:hypothetical protein